MIVFCTIYYVCSYVQTVPQIVKLLRTKSSSDYSLLWLAIQFIGLTCWSIYIWTSMQSLLVYVGTAIDLALLVFVDFLILRYFDYNKLKIKQKNTLD